jgi:hypothetical protein
MFGLFKCHELTELVCILYYCYEKGIVLLENIVISEKIILSATQNVNNKGVYL